MNKFENMKFYTTKEMLWNFYEATIIFMKLPAYLGKLYYREPKGSLFFKKYKYRNFWKQ